VYVLLSFSLACKPKCFQSTRLHNPARVCTDIYTDNTVLNHTQNQQALSGAAIYWLGTDADLITISFDGLSSRLHFSALYIAIQDCLLTAVMYAQTVATPQQRGATPVKHFPTEA
jgi:hypothetical protein